MFNPNQAFLLVQKLKLAPRLKKRDTIEFEKPICNQPVGANVLAFIRKLGPNNKPKVLKVGLKVSVKVGGPYYTLT
jgi:hypothetical protein